MAPKRENGSERGAWLLILKGRMAPKGEHAAWLRKGRHGSECNTERGAMAPKEGTTPKARGACCMAPKGEHGSERAKGENLKEN